MLRAAEVLVEPVHDEPALHFLAHAAGDHDDDGEDDGIAGRLDHCLERIVGDVVEARHERQHDSEKQHHGQKDHRHQRDAEQTLADERSGRPAGLCECLHLAP